VRSRGNVFMSAERAYRSREPLQREMKGQSHDFEREEQISEDDGGVDAEFQRAVMVTFGGERGLLVRFRAKNIACELARYSGI